MKYKRLILLIIFCLAASLANAELSYNDLEHSYKMAGEQTEVLDNYLVGLYEGMNAANIAYYMQSKTFFFCMPMGIELNAGDLRRMIRDSHETFDTKGDIPVSYLLFIGMRRTFPCL